MGQIKDVEASKQFKSDMVEYALYVQKHRTTPEIRDGLKPVQRRIVWAAQHNSHADVNRKSANVVGDTMGHYHPHGDSSIIGALYTLVNWYQTKVPLFEGQGNFGNTFQNVPAAPRYTEVKLSKFARECLLDELVSCKSIVDWIPTFDNSDVEPAYLPAKVPLLLINGCSAIAVGDKVDIPSHNLAEVIDTTIALIKNPKLKIALAPDHCQECEIVNTNWADINNKGFGKYTVRGKIDIEPYNGHEKRYKDCMTLVIKSCPNLTFLDSIVEKIEGMVKENKIIGILDLEEQSTDNNMRYVIVLKPGTDPNFMRNALYKNTQLSQTQRVNIKVLDYSDKEHPVKRVSYREYLNSWIQFRKITKFRLFSNKLQAQMTRLHELENYIWAINDNRIDEIVALLRKTKANQSDTDLVEMLIKKYKITDVQAKFILSSKLKQIAKSHLNEFIQEKENLIQSTQYLRDCILDDTKIEEIIIQELLDIKKKYGEPRKCRIIKESEALGVEEGEFKVVITENGFIKKMGLEDNILKPKNDAIKFVSSGDNSKSLLLFDQMGKVYDMPISKIPFADKNSSGVDIRVINKYINAPIVSVIYGPVIEKFKKGCLVTLSKNGFIKRVEAGDFISVPNSGLVYCKLDEGDIIVDILLFTKSAEAIIYGDKKALRINTNDIPLLKRNARGCVSMNGKNNVTEGISVMNKTDNSVVIVTKNGYVNKIVPESINLGRAKAGSNVIKLSKTDSIVAIYGADDNTYLHCITLPNGEDVMIGVKDVPQGTTLSTGTKMIKGEVVSVSRERVVR